MSRELIARLDAIGLLMDQGVDCTFMPVSGDSRTVRAIVTRGGMVQEAERRQTRMETLKAFVLRDPEESLGGIDAAELGSSLRVNTDPEGQVYSCTGDYDSTADQYSWTLNFVRSVDIAIGGNRRR
jgi:hypothetical protein